MSRLNELRLITRIAQMYHLESMRQAEIARRLHISQATVSRMLKKALDEEIVRTTIIAPPGTYAELEAALRKQYGLSEVIVVDCAEDSDGAVMARIGEAAAHLIETTLRKDEIIGVSSWSETVLKMVDNLEPLQAGKAKYVVQTLGGLGDPGVLSHASLLTTRLAKLSGAEPRLLPAHGVVQSREARIVMLNDSYVREAMSLFSEITLAIVGIGTVEPSKMLARSGNIFSEKELSTLLGAGAVGDMSLHFFDRDGNTINSPLDDRVIGISLEELSNVERVVGLAGGKAKIDAIHGALKTNIIDLLITDRFTAENLILVS